MRIPIGYKFIIGFVVVVAVVAFSPKLVEALGYSVEQIAEPGLRLERCNGSGRCG